MDTNEDVVQENIVYPKQASAVIDVTQAPYFADHTGQTDCTDILIRAFDDVMRTVLDGFEQTVAYLEAHPNADISVESKRPDRVIFPHDTPPSRILYFPNGTYLVSDTICYTFENLKNAIGNELNRQIHFLGQSREGVVIRLKDGAEGFGAGAEKPMLSFMRGPFSNVAMSNTLSNMTLDVGKGNAGAIGLLFHSSNNGAVRNVAIRTEDNGHIGLAVTKGKCMGLFKNVAVEGFDYGVWVEDFMLYTVFEHIHLKGQKRAGFCVVNNPVSIRKLTSHNQVPAIEVVGDRGHVTVVDSDLLGGEASCAAIHLKKGFLFGRQIKTEGYDCAILNGQRVDVAGPKVVEYVSQKAHSFGKGNMKVSLSLPVEETPELDWETEFSNWVCVNDFGAKGDGVSDDTQAIRQAMQAGKPVVYFNPGRYVVNGSIDIPSEVERVDFMFADLIAGEDLKEMANEGTFCVVGEGEHPLVIENLFAWEAYFGKQVLIAHDSTRTLILRDLHAQLGALYNNSVSGGKVFIENVSGTDKGDVCFYFKGQHVWARQLNPERANPEVVNDGGRLWVLGFKTEGPGVSFHTINGGQTEVLGGVVNNFSPVIPEDRAILETVDASVSLIASTNGRSEKGHYFEVVAREMIKGHTNVLSWDDVPRRYENQSVIPLYAVYSKTPTTYPRPFTEQEQERILNAEGFESKGRKNLIWEDGFEAGGWLANLNSGDTTGLVNGAPKWHQSMNQGPFSAQAVTEPVRAGKYAMRFEWQARHFVGTNVSKKATLLTAKDHTALEERWWGFSMYLPSDEMPCDAEPEILVQWHGSPDRAEGEDWRNPPMTINNQNDELVVDWIYDPRWITPSKWRAWDRQQVTLGTTPKDCWIDFVFHVKWHPWGDGFLKTWMNGGVVIDLKDIPIGFNDRIGPYMGVGLYKYTGRSEHSRRVVYFDEVRGGNQHATYEDVAPGH